MKIHTLPLSQYDSFLRIYNASFPLEERRPYADADALAAFVEKKKGRFTILAATDPDDSSLLGFITLWTLDGDVTYVEHFAVDEKYRGRNIGSRLLGHVMQANPRLLLEVELPADATSLRRIAFYARHGFRPHSDFPYLQPPYAPQLPFVPLMLMTRGDVKPTRRLVKILHATVYGQ